MFNYALFVAAYPEFVSFSAPQLNEYWVMAQGFINTWNNPLLCGQALQTAMNLMTAHLAKSFKMMNAGQDTVVVEGATQGSVTVSLQPPPVGSAYQWWLSTTAYGKMLRAFLLAHIGPSPYIGGSLDRSSIRGAGGVFGGRFR